MSFASKVAELRGRLDEIRPRLANFAARQRFWLEAAGITVLALVFLAAVGTVSLRRSVRWEEQAAALRAIETRMLAVVNAFEPADTAETRYWRESEQHLLTLASQAPDPLTVAGLVAQRSAEIGINSLRVSLDIAADSSGTDSQIGPIDSGDWSARPQPTVIVANFAGSSALVSRFVGILPPQVEVEALRIDTIGGSRRNEFRLVVRSIQGPT